MMMKNEVKMPDNNNNNNNNRIGSPVMRIAEKETLGCR